MSKKKVLFKKIYSITILMMLFTTALAGIQVMASTDSQESKVHWESNTKDEEIQVPDGLTGDGGKWESSTYTSSDDKTNNTSIETKPMSAGEEYAAILAGLMGVLAISATKSSSSESVPTVSEGNGIWVPESDRDAVTEMINKAASKEYYIDANGFVKEVSGAVENLNKSSTYSSVLDRLIGGDNKVVIGVGDGWVSSGENGLEANAFTGDNSGIAIGDNGTPQVVVVSGEDMPNSSADITLAHELIHALRGEEGIKSINTIGGINQDEEAHTIELENNIRKELGYVARTDGDSSDGGDGSYGKYSDLAEEDWYNKIDELQGSETYSGNAYSNSMLGAIAAAISVAVRIICGSPSSSSNSKSKSSSSPSSNSGSSSSSNAHSSSNSVPAWGSSYDDSLWNSVVGVVDNVVNSVVGWGSDNNSKPKQNWGTFWNSATKSLDEKTKNILSVIGTAIATSASKMLGFPTGWIKSNDGKWYNYKPFGIMAKGWIQADGKWYYLDNSSGQMKTGWIQDKGQWYNLGPSGDMQTGWIQDKSEWYYLNPDGTMKTGWLQENGTWYYLKPDGSMQTGWIEEDKAWYYFDNNGHIKKDWVEDNGKWYYLGPDCKMLKGWQQYGESWYYLDPSNGEMQKKWINVDGKTYYLDPSNGEMLKGWKTIDGQDYFFDYTSGEKKKGWIQSSSGWNYLDSDGVKVTGWMEQEPGTDKWYYFDPSHASESKIGWINDNGTSYYLDSDNKIKKGWMEDGNTWYYLDGSTGKMAAKQWQKYGNSWYYLGSDGKMQKDKWIKDENDKNWYYVDSNGVMKTGTVTIDGIDYNFDSNGQWIPPQPPTEDNVEGDLIIPTTPVTEGAAVKYILPSDYKYGDEEGTARSFLKDVGNTWLYFGDSVSKWQDENPDIMNAIGLAMIVVPGGGSTKLTVVEKDSTIVSLEVEEIAARIAQSRINIANGPTRFSLSNNAGLKHVLDRHYNPIKNAGQFTISVDELKDILSRKETISTPIKVSEATGQYKRIVDVGYDIGTVKPSMGSQSTSWIEIYTDPRGNLITAYPTPAPY